LTIIEDIVLAVHKTIKHDQNSKENIERKIAHTGKEYQRIPACPQPKFQPPSVAKVHR
jgi:hypothetical protein